MKRRIKIAIVGVGNCASSLVQGLTYYYRGMSDGLISERIGEYELADVEVVAAFDVDARKVGKDLSKAIFAQPNCTLKFAEPALSGTIVKRGNTLDGIGEYLKDVVVESNEPEVDVVEELKRSGAEILVNYLPVGSEGAARFYAQCALMAGCGMINCMPVFLASDTVWAERFRLAGLPILGDDIKSQLGATIAHRQLAQLFSDRGMELERTYQLNFGGNTDFQNMLERSRLASKKISKTRAVTSVVGRQLPANSVHVGPSDHVPWLDDRKWAYIRLEGHGFGGAPLSVEVKLEVHDSPNSAGVVADAIRYMAVAQDAGWSGPLLAPSAWLMKSPPQQLPDEEAREAAAIFVRKACLATPEPNDDNLVAVS